MLRDAADYITSQAEKETDLSEWQVAIEARSGPTMLARIAIMKALTVMSSGCLIPSVRIPFGGNGNSAQDEAAGWSSGLKAELGCLTSDKRRRRGRQGCRR